MAADAEVVAVTAMEIAAKAAPAKAAAATDLLLKQTLLKLPRGWI